MFKRTRTYFYCYMIQGGGTLTMNNGFATLRRRLNNLDRYEQVKEKIAQDVGSKSKNIVIISLQKV